MTIAVAATFPWGLLQRVVESMPGGTLPGGIILATDSRWTYGDRPPEDVGQKLWRLAPERGIGAVFAGDVCAAEEALELAQQRIELVEGHPDVIGNVVSGTLAEVYSAHRRKRPTVGPIYLLVGMANIHGQNVVIDYASDDNFIPRYSAGVKAIGWPKACEKFRARLPQMEGALLPRDGGSWSLDITMWAVHVVAHLFDAVIEPGDEATVGGGIQVATIGPEGWEEHRISRTRGDPGDEATWQDVTAEVDRMKRYRHEFNVPPLASGGFDLRIVSLCDDRYPFAAPAVPTHKASTTKARR